MNRRQMMMAAGVALAAFQDSAIERVSAAASATAGRAANEMACKGGKYRLMTHHCTRLFPVTR